MHDTSTSFVFGCALNHHHKQIICGAGVKMMFFYKRRHLAQITESKHHTDAGTQTVNSNVIGIQAGNAKCGLPPKFNGQSFVKIHVMQHNADWYQKSHKETRQYEYWYHADP